MKRTGLLGGSFNPIHVGHLRVAEEVREVLDLTRIIFIPLHVPPHKEPGDIIATRHRLAMAELAAEDNEAFFVSDIETRRDDKSYTLYTLRHFLKELPADGELFFIMGTDAFAEITTWHRWREVLPMCHFVVMSRPGKSFTHPGEAMPAAYAERYRDQGDGVWQMKEGARLIFLPVTPLTISSSDIRRHLQAGRSVRYLVPDPTIGYIEQHGLYGTTSPGAIEE